jgi:Ser/Thr protein kinase RdoA (MazF antagonist)
MTAAATHGMQGKLVAPDWPPLELPELQKLLVRFPQLGAATALLTHSPRPFSSASVVLTKRGKKFVKRHHRKVRDREGLLEEHRFLAYLCARGAGVPRLLADVDGETAIACGEWTYELFELPRGVDLYEEAISWTPFRSAAHARSAGAALACLHQAAEGYTALPRQPRPLVSSFAIYANADPSAAMRDYLGARPALAGNQVVRRCCDQTLELLAPFHAELKPLLPSLAPLWTQNDLHASNLFWSDSSNDAQATDIIDFGLADQTCAVYDLAQAIERNIVEWLKLTSDPASFAAVPIHFDHLRALLDGYDAARPLSCAEAAALAPMTALCHAEFALSEADYYLGVLNQQVGAALAYDDYLVGHARWFRSGPGGKLLDEISRWACAREARP